MISTPYGNVEIQDTFIADGSSQTLYDAMDLQRATQAYIWAIPHVSAARWLQLDQEEHKAKLGDIVIRETFDERLGMLTINNDTFYSAFNLHLNESGPPEHCSPDTL